LLKSGILISAVKSSLTEVWGWGRGYGSCL